MVKFYRKILLTIFLLSFGYLLANVLNRILFIKDGQLSEFSMLLTSKEFKSVTYDVFIFHIPIFIGFTVVGIASGVIRYYWNLNHPTISIMILLLWIDFIGVIPFCCSLFSFSAFLPFWARIIEAIMYILLAFFIAWISKKASDRTLEFCCKHF
ncbi:MAG: hypothetical protein QXH95_05270 [Thermoplasmata archaeon]